MYLTKLTLNLKNKQVRSEINSPYELHRTILKAFSHDPNFNQNKILFRIEKPKYNSIQSGIEILVQSKNIMPIWSNLTVKQNYFLTEPKTKQIQLKQLPITTYLFKLTANPTIKRNGKRYALYKENDQIQWLIKKGIQHGFKPIYLNCSNFTIGNKSKTKNLTQQQLRKSDIYHFGVNYTGAIQITDPEKALNALLNGIGPAKAFGFGLLTIAKND